MKKLFLNVATVFVFLLLLTNVSLADTNNKQYIQIHHQQQKEKAAQERARYNEEHYSNGNRRGLAEVVGGNNNNRYIELSNQEMTNEEYERFQRENRW